MPLFFQAVLSDSPTKAGLRLMLPSLALPIGGITTGIYMWLKGRLVFLICLGIGLLVLGNCLLLSLTTDLASWKYVVYLVPGNFGQGLTYPAILFQFIGSFEKSGTG